MTVQNGSVVSSTLTEAAMTVQGIRKTGNVHSLFQVILWLPFSKLFRILLIQ